MDDRAKRCNIVGSCVIILVLVFRPVGTGLHYHSYIVVAVVRLCAGRGDKKTIAPCRVTPSTLKKEIGLETRRCDSLIVYMYEYSARVQGCTSIIFPNTPKSAQGINNGMVPVT